MKKIIFLTIAAILCLAHNTAQAKKEKSFEGVVTYSISMSGDPSITSSMDMLPESMLTAVFKTRGEKSTITVMGQKTFMNTTTKKITALIDLSMLGMGSYCMENTIANQNTTESSALKKTGETKTICGHQAEKYSFKAETGDEVIMWLATDITLNAGVPILNDMSGLLPMEFEINSKQGGMGGIKIILTAKEITEKKVPNSELEPASDCQPITQEELQTLLQSFQSLGTEE